jgi:hypothetical protein
LTTAIEGIGSAGQRLPSIRTYSGNFQAGDRTLHRQHRGMQNIQLVDFMRLSAPQAPGQRFLLISSNSARRRFSTIF